MSLAPSKIMSWQFHKEKSAKKLNRDSYAQWKKNEANAKRIAESYKEKTK